MALSALRTPLAVPVQEPYTEVVPVTKWAASTAYVVGQIVRSVSTDKSPGSGNYYQCTVAGTSGASAPTWTTIATTVSDNGITWQDIGAGYAGDIVLRPNGLAGYLVGMEALANQTMATFQYIGCLSLPKASATTVVDGAAVYFDALAGLGVSSSPSYGFYVGIARGAWVAGQTSGLLVLNGALLTSTFAGGALTMTGALIAQSTLAVTGATTLSSTLAVTGAATLSSTLAVTGKTTLGNSLIKAVLATPYTATVSTFTVLGTAYDTMELAGVTGQAAYGWKFGAAGTAGQEITLIETAGYAGKLYPYTGGTINGLTATSGSITITAGHIYRCVCTAANTWFVADLGAYPVT